MRLSYLRRFSAAQRPDPPFASPSQTSKSITSPPGFRLICHTPHRPSEAKPTSESRSYSHGRSWRIQLDVLAQMFQPTHNIHGTLNPVQCLPPRLVTYACRREPSDAERVEAHIPYVTHLIHLCLTLSCRTFTPFICAVRRTIASKDTRRTVGNAHEPSLCVPQPVSVIGLVTV
jgi:hypothetical protein